MMKNETPRWLRNHNPLNIIHTRDRWLGQSDLQTDPAFVQFINTDYGYRAAFRQLHTYVVRHRWDTLREIIRHWCPDATAPAYTARVAEQTGIDPDRHLPVPQFETLTWLAIVAAMAEVENGTPDIDVMALIAGYQLYAKSA